MTKQGSQFGRASNARRPALQFSAYFTKLNFIRCASSAGSNGFAAITAVSSGPLSTASRQNASRGSIVNPDSITTTRTTSAPRAKPNNAPRILSASPRPAALISEASSQPASADTTITARNTITNARATRATGLLTAAGTHSAACVATEEATIAAAIHPIREITSLATSSCRYRPRIHARRDQRLARGFGLSLGLEGATAYANLVTGCALDGFGA